MVNAPKTVRAGDTWVWTDVLSAYPASDWSLAYHFSGPAQFSVTATADGDSHVVSVPATTTADHEPGEYRWIARATSGGDVQTVASGFLTVEPDLSQEGDHRSYNQRVLDALEAVIAGKATRDQLSYSIQGRSLQRMTWDQLLNARERFRLLVEDERGVGKARTLRIRFGPP